MFNKDPPYSTEVSPQNEADTLIMLHASHIHLKEPDSIIHIYAKDTDILLLAIYHLEKLESQTSIIMGSGEKKRLIHLKPISDKLGPA